MFENELITFEETCRCCKKTYQITARLEDVIKYESGEGYVQTCFPYLTPGERELIVSNTCFDCWKNMFSVEESKDKETLRAGQEDKEGLRNAEKGTYMDMTTYCVVNAYGQCPDCDQCGICHAPNPFKECAEWGIFWDDWHDFTCANDDDNYFEEE